jgi:nucleoside-diphosphate-sugar epimerase
MNCLVTGASGFVGSHLCERLIERNCSVVGIDSFEDFYPRWIKEKNISALMKEERFELIPEDINSVDIDTLLEKSDCVFHLAAQAGVRESWGDHFSVYAKNNIETTQRLLESAKDHKITKFIYASSSSVYGMCPDLPMAETSSLYPLSPYGVTKLAAEHLCFLYFKNFGIPTVSLRFFTVYGPRQRPDMAFHKFLKAIGEDEKITVYGDGKQTRDFTYVGDVIDACLSAVDMGKSGEVYNIGGGSQESLEAIFPHLENICGKEFEIEWAQRQKGDVLHTFAKIEKAKKDLDYSPKTRIEYGLQEEL